MKRIFIALATLIGASGVAGAAAACVDVIATPPVIRYDFTQTASVAETLNLTISDNCASSLRQGAVAVWLVDRAQNGPPYATLGRLPLEVRQGAVNIVHADNAARRSTASIRYARTGAPIVAQLDIRLPAGATSAISESRPYDLYWTYINERNEAHTTSRTVVFALDVAPAFEMSLAGGGRDYTMDFGDLTAGAVGVVNLRMRATRPFEVGMTSQNNGVMRRTERCGVAPLDRASPLNSVAYSTTLDGQPVDLRSPYRNSSPAGDAVSTFENAPLRIMVDPALDPASKLAGRYCDVITLRISPIR